ncbi:predicted protein [Aspergillus terreus NIH2624]|uniref:Uncharacterized protein n=1 Tax=Aspergillus terreus (strain NIH 2624 / FGSC A1156) TaxID=341663 RepID=Q0CCJ9_ASPTN|nr:uncharacterized protein ATEG_08585 [Aspergillus terreus NIH2624]EAU30717.1 predicted protein [Aspergillus terreus NIH2624]
MAKAIVPSLLFLALYCAFPIAFIEETFLRKHPSSYIFRSKSILVLLLLIYNRLLLEAKNSLLRIAIFLLLFRVSIAASLAKLIELIELSIASGGDYIISFRIEIYKVNILEKLDICIKYSVIISYYYTKVHSCYRLSRL